MGTWTLWPLPGWHFCQNTFLASPTAEVVVVHLNVAVVLEVAVLGTRLLWTDRNATHVDEEKQSDVTTRATESKGGVGGDYEGVPNTESRRPNR